jgi:hypothetical protein
MSLHNYPGTGTEIHILSMQRATVLSRSRRANRWTPGRLPELGSGMEFLECQCPLPPGVPDRRPTANTLQLSPSRQALIPLTSEIPWHLFRWHQQSSIVTKYMPQRPVVCSKS